MPIVGIAGIANPTIILIRQVCSHANIKSYKYGPDGVGHIQTHPSGSEGAETTPSALPLTSALTVPPHIANRHQTGHKPNTPRQQLCVLLL